ncbi:MAG: deoxyribonuclease IV [Anaerolineae bacterium]|nr:TIM barrel protein [Anaerolineae bacterium]MDW8102133.1 deoxyribonuclease IV [Anaerolineae bacterium]
MTELLFGTAGVPLSTPKPPSSEKGVKRIKELGLGCMELEFVQRVSMGEEAARLVRATASSLGVILSVHAPYYINLNSPEREKLEASKKRLLAAARVGWLCGARNVVFHPAFYHNDSPREVMKKVREQILEVREILNSEGVEVVLRPETTGKPSQFGSLEEIISLSKEISGLAPCIDFAHLHARSGGKLNSHREFASVLKFIRDELGPEALADMHIHISGIDYGPKGEKEHLNLKESDFRYEELLQALIDYGVKGLVICESPNLEEDALLLQRTWESLRQV